MFDAAENAEVLKTVEVVAAIECGCTVRCIRRIIIIPFEVLEVGDVRIVTGAEAVFATFGADFDTYAVGALLVVAFAAISEADLSWIDL